MKKIIAMICMLFGTVTLMQTIKAQSTQDLKAVVNQTVFDKIVASINIPFTMIEHHDPFKGVILANQTANSPNDLNSKIYTYDETKLLYKWAVENGKQTMFDDKSNEIKKGIQDAWFDYQNEIKYFLKNYEAAQASQSQTNNPGPKPSDFSFEGFNIDSLYKWKDASVDYLFTVFEKTEKEGKSSKWAAKVWLPYARVDLTERPKPSVNSPNFSVKDVKVTVTATGELWIQLPVISCCHWWGPICTCIRTSWVWKRIVSVTVSPKIGSDITTTFSIDGLKVFATGKFDKLYLDYDILREINIAGIANGYLKNRKFELYDASKFVGSLPYINQQFKIKDITLPPKNGEVEIDINIIHN